MWRLLRNRLSTKDNLFMRGVLPHATQQCVTECSVNETTQHLFLSCLFFASLSGKIRSWLDIVTDESFGVSYHFYQFVYSTCGLRARRSCMKLIWMCCVWVIWNERNNRVFKNKESTIH